MYAYVARLVLPGLKSLVYAIEQPFSLKGKCTQNESGLIVKVLYQLYFTTCSKGSALKMKGGKKSFFVLNRSAR